MRYNFIVYTTLIVFTWGSLHACRLQGSDIHKLYNGEQVYTGTMSYSRVGNPPMQRVQRGGKVKYIKGSPHKHWSQRKIYTGTQTDVKQGKAQCTYRAGSYVFTLVGDITRPPKEFKCPNLGNIEMVKELAEPGTELHTKWGIFRAPKDKNNLKAYTSLAHPPRITSKFGKITSKFSEACEFRFTRKWKTYALKVKGSSY